MKILILGATGQLGRSTCSNIYKMLNKGEISKLGLSFRSDPSVFSRNKNIVLHQFDINNRKEIERIFKAQEYDLIISYLHDTSKKFNNDQNFSDRIFEIYKNIFNIIDLVRAKRIIFASSGAVYGENTTSPNGFIESDIDISNQDFSLDNYSESKIYFEKKIIEWKERSNDRSFFIFRLFSVYGDDSRLGTKHAMTEFINQRRRGEDIVVSSPETTRSFLHLDDLSNWVCNFIKDERDVTVNFGSKNILNMYQLAKKISEIPCKYKRINVKVDNNTSKTKTTKYFCDNSYRESLLLEEKKDFDQALSKQIDGVA